ncbi:P-loop containing nucleoside triphosphate hydrolase protein [Leucogyrophana mollusca]|uniref:P-loop containing nucleoside triphosphate hydrolase protein n=1 Tax=Leucogyrophana mollusca TaxID=85980 RepID=A0ACB8AXQ0_9AGAM|nr:P-loop containing nucleoside triphosphate hydrolase protein [Leucogyrophana mollusca]
MAPKGTRQRQKFTQAASQRQPDGVPTRQTLNDEELQGLGDKLKEQEFQMRAILAQLQRKDVLVHAGTGAGKTAIAAGPHVHPSSKGKVTIMVSPLLALHDEQVETFRTEFKLASVAVNSSHGGCSKEVLEKIVAGTWQIVLISPEMLLSRRFVKEVLQNAEFGKRILSVVVDEAHVVSHWGSAFRKKYGTLGKIRYFLPRGTPVVAVDGYVSIDEGNDRANVSIVVRAIHNPLNTYSDLDFVVPPGIISASQIDKSFIYADNIAVGTEIIDHIEEILPQELRGLGLIRPYNAAHSKEYRQQVMEEFKQGNVRILVCTDALAAGMGCNIPDIDTVIQWKLPSSLSSFVQRAGRAARAKGRKGLAVLLVESSAYEIDLSVVTQPEGSTEGNTKGGKGKSKTNKKGKGAGKLHAQSRGVKRGSRGGENDAIFVREQPALDPQSTDEGLLNKKPTPIVPCCDICEPSLLNRTRPGVPPVVQRQTAVKRGEICELVQDELHRWRKVVRRRDFPNALHPASSILKDETIDLLAAVGPISTMEDLERVLVGQWRWYSRYGNELLQILSKLDIPPMKPLPKKPRGVKRTQDETVGTTTTAQRSRKRPAVNVNLARDAGTAGSSSQSALSTPNAHSHGQ